MGKIGLGSVEEFFERAMEMRPIPPGFKLRAEVTNFLFLEMGMVGSEFTHKIPDFIIGYAENILRRKKTIVLSKFPAGVPPEAVKAYHSSGRVEIPSSL